MAVAVILTAAAPAQAQGKLCNKRDVVLRTLEKKYGEVPVSMGLAKNGGVLEILTSEDESTWTILVTMQSGISCLLASGEMWVNVPALRGNES